MRYPVRLTLAGGGQPIYLWSPPETVRTSMDGSISIVVMPSGNEFGVTESAENIVSIFWGDHAGTITAP